MNVVEWPSLRRERLLVVHDPAGLTRYARDRYPQFDVTATPTYLAGIAALADQPARGVLVGVDPLARKLDQAVAGLRKAAGPGSRIVLCCRPMGEPAARDALGAGAVDYLICPPQGDELDSALALPTQRDLAESAGEEPLPTWEELDALAGTLAAVGQGSKAMLDRLCRLIADALRVSFVRIIADRDAAHVGDLNTEPALVETISAEGRTVGRILVGGRERGPFSTMEVQKLHHYGRLTAHLLAAAAQQQQWQQLAMFDALTQLPNRRYLMQRLAELIDQAGTERFNVTVLIFDLDGFKHFNDTYGHAAGDELIRETGQLFRRHCRQHDVVARYAGDEFVVVFWDPAGPRVAGSKHPSDALAVLRRFKQALGSHEFPKLGPDAVGKVTISGGLATFPWDARTPEDLIQRADQALLHAKCDGKDRIYLVGAEGQDIDEPAAELQSPEG